MKISNFRFSLQVIFPVVLGLVLGFAVGLLLRSAPSLAQEGEATATVEVFGSPVLTPVVPNPDPAPVPEEPAPPFSELLIRIIEQLGETLTAAVVGAIGVVQLYVVGFIRRLFPNDAKTATAINGGVAQLTAAVTSIVLALIAYGVVYLSGLAGSVDIGVMALAGATFIGGFGIHKVNKLSSLARSFKALANNQTAAL